LTYSGANTYSASSTAISTLYSGLAIVAVPNTASDATMQLTINGSLSAYLMKANSSGTYINIAKNDLMPNRAYYFIYDGSRFLWTNPNSSDQIETSGSSGNLLMISTGSGITDSGYSPTATPTANKIPISSTGSKLDTWISDATTSTKGIASFNTADFTVSSGSIVIKDSGINHLAISASGTNTHAQIDTHISNVSNPHSTTASQVGATPIQHTTDYSNPHITTASQVSAIPIDGWVFETATSASVTGTSFNVVSSASGIYTKGTRVRWKNSSTVKYGVVIGSSYSVPNTTVTLATNDDYAITSSMTEVYYSNVSTPEGYPTWFSWTPAITWTAGTAPSGTPASSQSLFKVDGSSCTINLYHSGYTPGATVTLCNIPLPITTASAIIQGATGRMTNGNTVNSCLVDISSGTTGRIIANAVSVNVIGFFSTYKF
jgi:hypothetical protein